LINITERHACDFSLAWHSCFLSVLDLLGRLGSDRRKDRIALRVLFETAIAVGSQELGCDLQNR
jgi:hypothetical protein